MQSLKNFPKKSKNIYGKKYNDIHKKYTGDKKMTQNNLSRAALAITLSKLKVFENPKISLEQYPTDSEVAAHIFYDLHMNRGLEGKSVADLGCGTGILGICALIYGAKKVHFVDVDKSVFEILKLNIKQVEETLGAKLMNKCVMHNVNVNEFSTEVDLVVQNPPFGTKQKHVDVVFLHKAFSLSKEVISLHKTATKKFITDYAEKNDFMVLSATNFSFPLKSTMNHHKKKINRIEVTALHFKKKGF